jgi:hypothetical protein
MKRLTTAQETYLLRMHLGDRGGNPATARALFRAGMLGADAAGNVVVTPAGRKYLDTYVHGSNA